MRPPETDDLDVLEAGLVEPGADLVDELGGHPAALRRRVEPDAVEPVAQRVGDPERLLGLVLERVDEHDPRHVRRPTCRSNARAASTVSPKISTSEWGIVPVGARPASRCVLHVHPDITDVLDYAAIVGGCVGASTPAGARLAGLAPTGTMPHSLVLIFGDTVEAALAFDRHVAPDVPRIVLVDTFKDEAEEALRVAHALGDRLYGVRLDTPSERGRVTADLVHEVRARLDQAGFDHVKIIVSGGLNPDRIALLQGGRRAGRLVRGRLATSAAPRRSTSPATSRRSTASRSPSAGGSPGSPIRRASRRSTWRPYREA